VSLDSLENQTHGYDECPAISADGRYVAFSSNASTLVSNDTNGRQDVFVRDCVAGVTERVSVSSGGVEGDGHSYWCRISGDGSKVAFRSGSSNLVAEGNNGYPQIYWYDRLTHQTVQVSQSEAGEPGDGAAGHLAISTDGRYIAFGSSARNLVPDDTNDDDDVFVRDMQTGSMRRVSISGQGVEANNDSARPAISAGGEIVAFQSRATNLTPPDFDYYQTIFIHTRGDCDEPYVLASPVGQHVPAGGRAAFHVQAGGNPPPDYQWRMNGVDIPGATGATLTVDDAGPDDAGVYDAVVTNIVGSTVSAPATLSVGRLGDMDADDDVDADDFVIFGGCLVGPDISVPPPGCDPTHFARADLDSDNDVDLTDLLLLQRLIGQP
jgi:hypothetical protein